MASETAMAAVDVASRILACTLRYVSVVTIHLMQWVHDMCVGIKGNDAVDVVA